MILQLFESTINYFAVKADIFCCEICPKRIPKLRRTIVKMICLYLEKRQVKVVFFFSQNSREDDNLLLKHLFCDLF